MCLFYQKQIFLDYAEIASHLGHYASSVKVSDFMPGETGYWEGNTEKEKIKHALKKRITANSMGNLENYLILTYARHTAVLNTTMGDKLKEKGLLKHY